MTKPCTSTSVKKETESAVRSLSQGDSVLPCVKMVNTPPGLYLLKWVESQRRGFLWLVQTKGGTYVFENTAAITPSWDRNNHQFVMRYVAIFVHIILLHMLTRLATVPKARLAASALGNIEPLWLNATTTGGSGCIQGVKLCHCHHSLKMTYKRTYKKMRTEAGFWN